MQFFKSLLLTIVFIFTLLVFIPKENIYFLIEKELNKYDIVLSDELFKSTLIGFSLKNANLYVKGVKITKLDSVNISLLGAHVFSKEVGSLYTKLDVDAKNLVIYFNPTKKFIKEYRIVLKYLQKQKNGKYKYEYKLF